MFDERPRVLEPIGASRESMEALQGHSFRGGPGRIACSRCADGTSARTLFPGPSTCGAANAGAARPRRRFRPRLRDIRAIRIGWTTTSSCLWTLAGLSASRRPMKCWQHRSRVRSGWSSWATRSRRDGSWMSRFPASRISTAGSAGKPLRRWWCGSGRM